MPIAHSPAVGTNSSLNTAWISCCTAWASQGETVRNRCQAKTMLWSISGSTSDGPPKTMAIGSTLLRPSASSSPRRYPKECSRHSRRPKQDAKRPCNLCNRAAAAQFDRIHDKVLLQTSMNRRTGQFDQPCLLYASKLENLQYQNDAVEHGSPFVLVVMKSHNSFLPVQGLPFQCAANNMDVIHWTDTRAPGSNRRPRRIQRHGSTAPDDWGPALKICQ